MRFPSTRELEEHPVIAQGQADDLHIENVNGESPTFEGVRIWLSRTGVADGEPYENTVTIEVKDYGSNNWQELYVYDGDDPPDEFEVDGDVFSPVDFGLW